jgi:hypothetical protein
MLCPSIIGGFGPTTDRTHRRGIFNEVRYNAGKSIRRDSPDFGY